MNRSTRVRFVAALALPMLAAACAHRAEPVADAHADHAAHVATAATAPADNATAVRFIADEPLSRGMARVRAASDLLAHAAMGHMGPEQVKQQAAELKAAVDGMFAECKLQPAADAAAHPLLARVLTVSAAMAGGDYDAAAHADLKAVLVRYAELFDDSAISVDHSDST